MRALTAVALIALLCAGFKTHDVHDRPGGIITYHVAEFVGWQQHHDRVVISGECNSACTVLLGIVDPSHICATSRGSFGFHSGSLEHRDGTKEYSEEGTRFLWFFYGRHVREALANAGWPEPSKHPDIIKIKATDLVARCN